MRTFILIFILFIYGTAPAQFRTDALFTKYSNRNGVSSSTDVTSLPMDSTTNVALSMTVKTLTVENEDEEKKINRLTKQILRACNKILNQKEYVAISWDKDGTISNQVYKYHSGDRTEIFELEQEGGRLTLTVTRIIGITNEMVDFKIQTSKGRVEGSY